MKVWEENGEIFIESLLVIYSDEFEKYRGIAREGISESIKKINTEGLPILYGQCVYSPRPMIYYAGVISECEDTEEGLFVKGILNKLFWEELRSSDASSHIQLSYGFREKENSKFDIISAEIIQE